MTHRSFTLYLTLSGALLSPAPSAIRAQATLYCNDVEGFRSAVQQAGNSTADKRGMWADSSFEDLVQYNDGFRTQLIGTPEQIAERIAAYRKRGVDLILGGFLHFQEEIEYFGTRVLPLVREIEASESVGEPVLVTT